jgi:hypothetical protein
VSGVAGKSVLDLLQEKLDEYVDALQAMEDPDGLPFAEMRGRAHGAAMCLALVLNPYAPDLAAVKAEALARWENQHDEPEPGSVAWRRARRQARRAARNG